MRDRGYSEQQIKHALKGKQGNSFKSLNVVFHGANNLKYDYFTYVLNLYNQYKRGCLPFSGPVSQQPAKIIEIFNVLEQLELEQQDKQRTALEKEQKKRGKN